MPRPGLRSRAARSAASLVLLLAAGTAACGDAADPAPPLDALSIEGRVLDQGGQPVPGAVVILRVSTSAKEPSLAFEEPYAVTGPDGGYAVSRAGLAALDVDSIGLEILSPGCPFNASLWSTRAIDLADIPDGASVSLDIDLTAETVLPRAESTPGVLCAAGLEPFWGPGSFGLAMKIDSVASRVVYGRWYVYYQRTSAGPDGTFAGVEGDGLLVLSLADTSGWHPCTEVRLVMQLGTAGSWGPAQVVSDDGCLPVASPLTFARLEGVFFP
jgi:hypothetical protein